MSWRALGGSYNSQNFLKSKLPLIQSFVVRLDDSWLDCLPNTTHSKIELRKCSPSSSLKDPFKRISWNTSAPRIKPNNFYSLKMASSSTVFKYSPHRIFKDLLRKCWGWVCFHAFNLDFVYSLPEL